MRKALLVLTVFAFGIWGASSAMADVCSSVAGNLVANCGFETGDFTGWTVGGNTANPGANYYGVDAFDANSGNYGAYMSQDEIDGGPSPVTLSQSLATAPGGYTITFFLNQDTLPDGGYDHSFAATLGGTTLTSLNFTAGSPGTTGWTEYMFNEYVGTPNTTLSFSFGNDDNYWSFDDVSVVLTPEPSSCVLLGSALFGLIGLRRKKAN